MSRRVSYVVASACAALVMFSALYWSEGWRFGRSYDRLTIGMSRGALVDLFGRQPDVQCRFQSLSVLYFNRGSFVDSPTDTSVSKDPATRQEIPNLYAHAQLLLDSNDRLIAYTLNGETSTVVTAVGTFPGSRLTDLDDDAWARLIAR